MRKSKINDKEKQRRKREQNARYYQEHKEEIKARVRQYRHINQDDRREYDRRYYQSNKEKIKIRVKEYYQANKDKIDEYQRQWQEEHREERREYKRQYAKKWRTENLERYKETKRRSQAKRRARKLGGKGTYTPEQFNKLCELFQWCCACCGISHSESRLTEDHIIPLSKGGTNTIDNIQPLCLPCNMRKNDKVIDYRNGIACG